ncbi:MAG: hypothetical protein E2O40_03580 [Planctomycetota bacterium]|nr:MAG: hypothetical protein E2O40_03580 [Planctomycetota bacterium]
MAAKPLPPTGVFTYPGDTQIQDILLLPDGRHGLALFRIGSINLWSVLVYHWIEIVAAIAVCVLLLVLNHLIRRPRRVGKPYCRRCNYLLIGVGDTCPECGASVAGRNRVTGRSRRPRFVLVAVLLGVVVGGYAVGNDRIPRDGIANSWCLWLSPGLYDWAYHNDQHWLTRHKSTRCRVVEIDLADGAVTRTLFSRDGIMPGEFALHPDGTSFFLSQGDAVSQHDLGSGRSIASLRAADVGVTRLQRVTVNAGGDTVYVASMDHRVWAWHPRDGSHEEVVRRPGFPSKVFLVPYRDRAVFTTFGRRNHLTGMFEEHVSTLVDLVTLRMLALLLLQTAVRMSQDGCWIVCPEYKGFGVWEADTGVRRQTIPAPWLAASGSDRIVTGADARFVVLPKYGPTELHLWDVEKADWAGSCAGPVNQWVHALLSSDRSVLAAVGVSNTQYMILTWDLTQLSPDADSADHDLP